MMNDEILRQIAFEDFPYYIYQPAIASGAFGSVHEGEDLYNGKSVAIKIIPFGGDQKVLESFLRETGILINISKPPVCDIDIVCLLDRFIYIDGNDEKNLVAVMNYVNGPTLQKYIDVKKITEESISDENILKLGKWIFNTLCRLHLKNIAHRDIKPANIILKEDTLDLVLVDFGFSCEMYGSPLLKCDMVSKGSPFYASPELWERNITPINIYASDVWAAGIIMYSLADKRHKDPWTATELNQLRKQIIKRDISPLDIDNSTIKELIEWILTYNPKDRPSACEVLDRIKKIM